MQRIMRNVGGTRLRIEHRSYEMFFTESAIKIATLMSFSWYENDCVT